MLKVQFAAEVSDGHGHTESQPLTVTLVGANSATDTSAFGVVNGTTAADTFNHVGGNVTIFGNGGPDTFVFKPGFGSATIADFDVNNDTIEISKSLFPIWTCWRTRSPANSGHGSGHYGCRFRDHHAERRHGQPAPRFQLPSRLRSIVAGQCCQPVGTIRPGRDIQTA